MPTPVSIPRATLSMEEGSVIQWLKSEGDTVTKDEVLFELETDKATLDVPSPEDGVLLRILVKEGPAAVESVVGWIGQPGEAIDAIAKHTPDTNSAPASEQAAAKLSKSPRVLATPAARRRSAELNVDLSRVRPRKPSGRITQEDVERTAAAVGAEAAVVEQPLSARQTLIQRLTATWQSVPHIQIARTLDADGLAAARKTQAGQGVSVTDLLLYTLASVLRDFPELTVFWDGDRLLQASQINLAFAVDTSRGVVAPVIPAADSLELEALSRTRQRLTEAAVAQRLHPEDIEAGVFTLTNLGMQKVDFFAPVINSPQVAILATGRMIQEPIFVADEITVGWRVWANLALDHRVADGMAAARFLEQLQIAINKLPRRLDRH